jgi:hypothetical protein
MKLIIGGNPVALPLDGKISIERSSPYLNEDTGSFSYPFPVPTLPNQQHLGWPGNLNRTGDIADQSFILEAEGLQILLGEVGYDDITASEIGVILQSGHTEFTRKMEGLLLGDLDYGSEWWPVTNGLVIDMNTIRAKLAEWDSANTTDNGKYVLSPFRIKMSYAPTADLDVNKQFWPTGGNAATFFQYTYSHGAYHGLAYCLQFRIHFVLQKIFESAGYNVLINELALSEFNKAIFYSNVITLQIQTVSGIEMASPVMDVLRYAMLMPRIDLLSFLSLVRDFFCLAYEINELKKEVRIKFRKDIFLTSNLDAMQIRELAGWTHSEKRATRGFSLRYTSQDSELDTYTDWPDFVSVVTTLPAPRKENEILKLLYDRYFITVINAANTLEWKEVGRLRDYTVGEGENVVELSVRVPVQVKFQASYLSTTWNLECPSLPAIIRGSNDSFTQVPFLAITLYHGRKTFDGLGFPFATFDRYSQDGTKDMGMSLKPAYLYETLYSRFLNWQTYRARYFTKYIELSLVQLSALQWGKRYMIGGVQVILSKVNYDLPFDGKVKVEGYTV